MSDTDRQPDAAPGEVFEKWWKDFWVSSATVSPSKAAREAAMAAFRYASALRSSPSAPSRDAVLEEALTDAVLSKIEDDSIEAANQMRGAFDIDCGPARRAYFSTMRAGIICALKTAPQGHESGGACSKTPHPSHDPAAAAPGDDARDAARYRWLRQYLQVQGDAPDDWTCWLGLECIPFRSKTENAEGLLDTLMERFPLNADAAMQRTKGSGG